MGAGLPVVDVEDEDGDDNAEAWLDRYKLFQFSIVTKDNGPRRPSSHFSDCETTKIITFSQLL